MNKPLRIIPHPIHDWEDEQRRLDLVENLEQWAISHLDELIEHNEFARVERVCTEALFKAVSK